MHHLGHLYIEIWYIYFEQPVTTDLSIAEIHYQFYGLNPLYIPKQYTSVASAHEFTYTAWYITYITSFLVAN